MTNSNAPSKHLFSKFSFAMGNFGHAAFYGALSNYFIVYVTSVMFVGVSSRIADKLIGLITGLIVLIRILEIFINPLLGNIVDNTHSRWGKFKPWILSGTIISSVLLIALFAGLFGLIKVNWILYAIVFVIVFVVMDIFYSFSDVSYWGMVPALSEDSAERGVYTSLGTFTGAIGWNGLTIIVVPVVTYFTYLTTGKHEQGAPGWFAFAVIISLLAIVCATLVTIGTHEKDNLLRRSAQQKTTIKDVISALAHNDQLLWTCLAYFMYSLANTITTGVLYYFFKFVLGKPGTYWIVGMAAMIISFCTSPLYPVLNRFIPRKWLYTLGMVCMMIAYLIFIFFHDNLTLLVIGLVLYYFTFAQLVSILTMTDSIEYGQLKNGERNEAVILSIRPLIDNLTGAFSNGLVGYIAIAAGMTGAATAADMTAKNIATFNSLAFYIPFALSILSLVIFLTKVKLSEKAHAEIVDELTLKLAAGQSNLTDDQLTKSKPASTKVFAPVDGDLIPMGQVKVNGQPFPGTGFAIRPSDGHIYAPFDGRIVFTFSTKHLIGLVSDQGLEAIIHIGIDTVNLNGQGFVSHYSDGQTIQAGDLLMDFDRELINQNHYDDTVIMFFTKPQQLLPLAPITERPINHGDLIEEVQNK